jgi:pyridinium-3,5-biscarboxylic acid mononucleotide sulfurtransferase
MPHASDLLDALRHNLRSLGSVLVCFSGGIDSALVLAVAYEQLGERALGLTAVSPSLAAREREAAASLAAQLGGRHQFIDSNELARQGYVDNRGDRCFYCKSELYELARLKADEFQLQHVANGTNADDLSGHRPGLKAATLASVRSPLLELGLSKQDVRDVAKLLNLPIWNKPALACLASRIPPGTQVTAAKLAQIEQLESAVLDLGFSQVRVRFHDSVARIELTQEQLPLAVLEPARSAILNAGRAAGFLFVTLDLAGYEPGSLNRMQAPRSLPVLQTSNV